MLKKILLSLIIVFGLMSCEKPVHEEYEMDGELHDWSDGGGNDDSSGEDDDSSGDGVYLPLATGNIWVMKNNDTTTSTIEIIGTEEIEGNTYYKISSTNSENDTESFSYMRKDGDTYINRIDIEYDLGGGMIMESDPFYSYPLKDNVSVGDSWVDNLDIVYHYSGTEIVYNYIYTYTVADILDTYESHGTTYNDVMKLKINISLSYMGTEMSNTDADYYYALDLGLIEGDFGQYGSQYLISHSLE